MTSFVDLVPAVGYLSDDDIRIALENNHLMESGTWEAAQIRHASYTLRLGGRVEITRRATASFTETNDPIVVRLMEGGSPLELKPGDTALLYSKEHLRLPDCVLGFTIARGLLFAEALCPENTYIDPGFPGPIYTTVTNISNRVVYLPYGISIARLFFYKLPAPVKNAHKAGEALGIEQQLKTVRAVRVGSVEECQVATESELCESIRQIPLGGNQVAECIDRLRRSQRTANNRLFALAAIWPALLAIANGNEWIKNNVGGFLANVGASVVAAALVYALPRIKYFTTAGSK